MARGDLKDSFGAIARQYDAARPSYPEAIVSMILNDLPPRLPPSILEIGCGSGQATELFARLRLPIVATDPSAALLDIARERLSGYPNVRYQQGAFEDLPIADDSYPIVLSAQAFHWIDPAIGMPKLYRILQPGGVVALVWNFIHYDADPALAALRDGLVAAVPLFAGWPDAGERRFNDFAASWHAGFQLAPFVAVRERVLPSTLALTHEQVRRLIASFSWFQTQPAGAQAEVLRLVDRALAAQPADVRIPLRTLLVLARKAPGATPARSEA